MQKFILPLMALVISFNLSAQNFYSRVLGGAPLSTGTNVNNTSFGFNTLIVNTADNNTALGTSALRSNTTGAYNTATGIFALSSNTTGNSNTANGVYALHSNTTGINNVANGQNTLRFNTTGSYNIATGIDALYSNSIGMQNVANGSGALYSNATGSFNTANGQSSLYSNTTGKNNTANGYNALKSNTTGANNTSVGILSGANTTTGELNVFIGSTAGNSNTTGHLNTCLGANSGTVGTISNATVVGANASVSVNNGLVLGQVSNTLVGIGTSSPTDLLHVKCTPTRLIRFQDLPSGTGNVLVIDANGFIWKAANTTASLVEPKIEESASLVQGQQKTIREQQAQIEDLQNQINQIKAELGIKTTSAKVISSNPKIQLEQNAPNPTNSQTVINYEVPKEYNNVSLVIADLTGRAMKSIELTDCCGSISLDTKEFPLGTYIYSLVWNNQILSSKKMIIFK